MEENKKLKILSPPTPQYTKNKMIESSNSPIKKSQTQYQFERINKKYSCSTITNTSTLLTENIFPRSSLLKQKNNSLDNINTYILSNKNKDFNKIRPIGKVYLKSLQAKNNHKFSKQSSKSHNQWNQFKINQWKQHQIQSNCIYQQQKQMLNKLLYSYDVIDKQNIGNNKYKQLKNIKNQNYNKIITNQNKKLIKKSHFNHFSLIQQRKNKQDQGNGFDEKQIFNSAEIDIRYHIRKNGQFLITPKISRRVFSKPTNNSEPKKQLILKLPNFKHQYFVNKTSKQDQNQAQNKNEQIIKQQQKSQYIFKQLNEELLTKSIRLTDPKMHVPPQQPTQSQQNLLSLIQSGNYFGVQIELSLRPQLLLTKDNKNNNNLLHICIMKNKPEIFMMVVNKSRDLDIQLLAQKNKYGRNPVQLANILKFFNQDMLDHIYGKPFQYCRFQESKL